jgi:iron(III) transport system ATP-binding protein
VNETANDLVVTDLHKSFGPRVVLSGLELTVPQGSFCAVLGPSGSGKTTLLRILAGFDRPDRGRVAVGDMVFDDETHHVAPEHRRIGYVSQDGSLFPHLNVESNIAFGLARRDRRGATVDELLEAVGLAGARRQYPHQLSGGQQQRVALARALAVDPHIVLLDEPFAALDDVLRQSVRSDVHEILRSSGATAILVTHDQDEALSMADLVAVMRDGRIAQVASPKHLYHHPVDAELARLVGGANLIDGVARHGDVETALGTLRVREDLVDAPQGAVTVLVRPEQVVLSTDASAPGVRGRVVHVHFHGHDAQVRVALETREPLTVTARVLGRTSIATDSDVVVSVEGPVETWREERRPSVPRATGAPRR